MPSEFERHHIVKARTWHVCSECGKDIPVGCTYRNVVGRFDGDFMSLHYHIRCGDGSQHEDYEHIDADNKDRAAGCRDQLRRVE